MSQRRFATGGGQPSLEVALFIALFGCAKYPPTNTAIDLRFVASPPAQGSVLDVVVQPYVLAHLDSVEGSRPSRYAAAHERALALAEILAPEDVRVLDATRPPTSRYWCDFRIHWHFHNEWTDFLISLLPVPRSVNDSVCITAELHDQQLSQKLTAYQECGFSSYSGFWVYGGSNHPPIRELESYMTKKLLQKVVEDYRLVSNRAQ